MTFVSQQLVRFAHIDAAGIVFYPRYFEMLNAAVEDYFASQVRVDFGTMHLTRRLGVPIVKLECEFMAPSRLGDLLEFRLDVTRIGRSSVDFSVEVRCAAQIRFQARMVLVCMNLDSGSPVAWPMDLRPVEGAQAA